MIFFGGLLIPFLLLAAFPVVPVVLGVLRYRAQRRIRALTARITALEAELAAGSPSSHGDRRRSPELASSSDGDGDAGGSNGGGGQTRSGTGTCHAGVDRCAALVSLRRQHPHAGRRHPPILRFRFLPELRGRTGLVLDPAPPGCRRGRRRCPVDAWMAPAGLAPRVRACAARRRRGHRVPHCLRGRQLSTT